MFGKACFNILEDHQQKIHHGQFHWKICCSLEHLWVTASRILKWDYKWDFETERRIIIPEIVTKIAYCNKAVEIFATSIQHAKNIPLFHYFFIESALLGLSSEKQMFWKHLWLWAVLVNLQAKHCIFTVKVFVKDCLVGIFQTSVDQLFFRKHLNRSVLWTFDPGPW